MTTQSTADKALAFPSLYCPIPPASHPRLEDLARRSREWIGHFDFFADASTSALIENGNWAEAASLCYPAGTTERVQCVVDWVVLVCLFDELVDEPSTTGNLVSMGDLFGRMVRTLEVPGADLFPAGDPVAGPWTDLARRIHRLATPDQLHRIVEGHRQWFQGVLWEQTHVRARSRPSLNEYATLRMLSVGGPTTSSMIGFTRGCAIPPQEAATPLFRAVSEVALLLYGWGNDFLSYAKDRARLDSGAGTLNLVDLIMREEHLDANAAIVVAGTYLDALMLLFLNLRDTLMRSAGADMRDHLMGLDHLVRGVLDWHLAPRTQRFQDDDRALRVDLVADLQGKQLDLLRQPLPFPSIRWWWGQASA